MSPEMEALQRKEVERCEERSRDMSPEMEAEQRREVERCEERDRETPREKEEYLPPTEAKSKKGG